MPTSKWSTIGRRRSGTIAPTTGSSTTWWWRGQWAVWSEAIEFGRQAGIEPRLLSEHLEFGVPESLYGEDFSGGGTLGLHYKDLGYILDLAHDTGANIPITGLVHEIFKASKVGGERDWSQPGIVTYWRRLNRPR